MSVVVVLALPGVPLFHLSIAGEVFGPRQSAPQVPAHEVRVVTERPGAVVTREGMRVEVPLGLDALAGADLVVVPWSLHAQEPVPPAVLDAVRTAHAAGARIAGCCGGTFVLAEAGLLDGRRATTHWHYTERLARLHPQVEVVPEVLFVDEGDVLTAAGTAAAIDLCLHLRRQLDGAEAANAVARGMVVAPHRSGGQAQFIETPVADDAEDDRVSQAMTWALEHLDRPLGVDDLAARAFMSRRTFTRRFRASVGTSTVQWLLQQRTLLAQRLLETTDLPVEAVADRAGFGSAVAMRTHFSRSVGLSPRDYRATFSRRSGVA
ncbi:transcriptional regulator GlxA family with amidase domain [Motilibacter peucedani]|uniref:Transcriptional regulator GlxA family with amidase domain n=1 Tax=Motilibacter peucedani TaxID=598650 RepID=A0A420XLG4_9ACTN|nr:helix-turn-helix domain-containing protein [Motilibacter peucedani]RKS69197.1 transcriptional regulator GlxA family with amidase domain [Motilibacter peucedani]